MSLINDALKKAQRLRSEPPIPGELGGPHPGGRVEKRKQPLRAQTVILLAAAAAVLIVFSVVFTVYWLNRPEPVPARPANRPAKTSAAEVDPTPVVPIQVPQVASEKSAPPAPNATAAAETAPAPRPVAPSPSNPTSLLSPPTAALSTPAPAPLVINPAPTIIPPASAVRTTPDPRIQSAVDAFRVTGVRSSGTESKVLMNDRVYRLNDVVDRTLGLKLVKVESGRLTFTDANGLTYVKEF